MTIRLLLASLQPIRTNWAFRRWVRVVLAEIGGSAEMQALTYTWMAFQTVTFPHPSLPRHSSMLTPYHLSFSLSAFATYCTGLPRHHHENVCHSFIIPPAQLLMLLMYHSSTIPQRFLHLQWNVTETPPKRGWSSFFKNVKDWDQREENGISLPSQMWTPCVLVRPALYNSTHYTCLY